VQLCSGSHSCRRSTHVALCKCSSHSSAGRWSHRRWRQLCPSAHVLWDHSGTHIRHDHLSGSPLHWQNWTMVHTHTELLIKWAISPPSVFFSEHTLMFWNVDSLEIFFVNNSFLSLFLLLAFYFVSSREAPSHSFTLGLETSSAFHGTRAQLKFHASL
jgi:hypothetical protein